MVLDDASRRELRRRLEIEMALPAAVLDQQFCVRFQPIVDPRSRTLHGAEALVRWRHPVHGTVGPDEFIAIAEECGAILDIGRAVRVDALGHAAVWTAAGHRVGVVGINAAPAELAHPGFATAVLSELERRGLGPQAVALEITESAISASADATHSAVHELSDAGVSICIDDFGTGFSSMERLRDLPVHMVKVDRSFVATLDRSERDRRIVQGIISFARSIELTTVAEGVETPEQEEMLVEMGVDLTQGFLYDRPLDPQVFAARWFDATAAATRVLDASASDSAG